MDPPPTQASVKGGHSNAAVELGNSLSKIVTGSLIYRKVLNAAPLSKSSKLDFNPGCGSKVLLLCEEEQMMSLHDRQTSWSHLAVAGNISPGDDQPAGS